MKTVKSSTTSTGVKKTDTKPDVEIKTDFPLSEKDEVKQAEHKLQKAQKNGDK